MSTPSRNSKRRALASALCFFAWTLYVGPVAAQIDLTGNWMPRLHEDYQIRFSGPDFVDYLGIPLNAQGRASAMSYTASTISEQYRECAPYPETYMLLSPQNLRIQPVLDSQTGNVEAWHVSGGLDRNPMTIWIDGRPQPGPQALNSSSGFSTGVWEGDTLIATTTHMKDGFLTRNGVPISNRATFTMYISKHDELLTITGIIQDPIYLEAPYILSRSWVFEPRAQPTEEAVVCTPAENLDNLAHDQVASTLPSKNPLASFMQEHYHIPTRAAKGGGETMFPEFAEKIRKEYSPPGYCDRYCCGSDFDIGFVEGVLMCTHGP